MNDWLLKKSCQVRNGVESFVKGEEAPTAVEYGIMVALIAAVIIVAVQTIGTNLNTVFTDVGGKIPATTGGTT